MVRRVITDEIWLQLEAILRSKGCHKWKNDRNVFEAILWKLRTGAPWRDIPEDFCPWKTAYNKFNRWAAKGLWDAFFLSYEEKLIKSGYSPMEVTLGLISMQVELGRVKRPLLESHLEDLLQKYTFAPMRMEIRSILKSLGVTSTTPKLQNI